MRAALVLCAVLAVLSVSGVVYGKADWTVFSANRLIDLNGNVVTHSIEFELSRSSSDVVNKFQIPFLAEHIALVTAQRGGVALEVEKEPVMETHGQEYAVFNILLDKSAPAESRFKLNVRAYFAHAHDPFPKKIDQSGHQLTEYHDNHYISSSFSIASQTTTVSSAFFQYHSEERPTRGDKQEVVYGPYERIRAFSFSPLRAHVLNSGGLITVKRMVREIEVSHWGNVAVEEVALLENEGALLKGPFSRLDYMMGQKGNSVNEIIQFLPPGSQDVYYRDVIGNVSSSHVRTEQDGRVKLELTPRFMLFGGWKVEWKVGYNIPSEYNLFHSGSQYSLEIPFANIYENAVADLVEFHIVLPEGASDIEVHSPYRISEVNMENRITYLDLTGRPVLVFTATNILPQHTDTLKITYHFQGLSVFREPIMAVTGVLGLFIALIFINRIRLTISDTPSSVDFQQECLDLLNRFKDMCISLENTFITSGLSEKYQQEKGDFVRNAKECLNSLRDISSSVASTGNSSASSKIQDLRQCMQNHCNSLQKEHEKRASKKGKSVQSNSNSVFESVANSILTDIQQRM